MKTSIISLIVLILSVHVFAQERIGLANSNYAGTTGMPLNPSSMVDSKAWLDINLVGADVFAWNNYVYLSKDNFYFWRNVLHPQNFPVPLDRMNGKNKHGVVNLRVDGPSFTLSQGKNAFGFHTAARTFVSLEDFSEPSAKFIYEGLDYAPQQGIPYQQDKLGAYATAWAEVGVSYGRIVFQEGKDMVTAGITAKYLMGIGHVSAYLDDLGHTVVNGQDWNVTDFTGQYAITQPGFANGHGFGVDLGVTYKRMLENVDDYAPHTAQSDCGTIDYRYRIGLSLIDLGGIRFSKNSLIRNFNRASANWQNYPDVQANSLSEVDALIKDQFVSDGSVVTSESRYGTSLPSAVSVQFDYNLGKNFYGNATWVQGFQLSKGTSGIRRSLLAITPRYEHKWFEASLPLSLYDYRFPQLGLAFRFYSITIGSDNILPFFVPMDVYGANIYASVKITLFKDPMCGKGRKSNRAKRTGKGRPSSIRMKDNKHKSRSSAVSCPAFM